MTGTVETPEWTDEDRAALLGLQQYEATLCPGCGHPKQTAWHSDMTGWWKSQGVVCHACTAASGTTPDGKPNERVFMQTFVDPKTQGIDELPPLQIGVNTATPSDG